MKNNYNYASYTQLKRAYFAFTLSIMFILFGPLLFSISAFASNALIVGNASTTLNDSNTIATSVVSVNMINAAEPTASRTIHTIELSDETTIDSFERATYEVAETAVSIATEETIEVVQISEPVITYFNSTVAYEITDEERELLARLVELEAGNQTLEERAKVIQVVFNRVEDGRFGDGIEGVIFEPNQFEPAPNIPYTTPSELSYQAVDAVVSGELDLSNFDCLYFWGDGQLNHFY